MTSCIYTAGSIEALYFEYVRQVAVPRTTTARSAFGRVRQNATPGAKSDIYDCFVAREMKRDSLNAIRRLAIYHGDVLSSRLHAVNVAVVAEVPTTSSLHHIIHNDISHVSLHFRSE